MYWSGVTSPPTTFSPRPHAALMTIVSGKPVSESIVNMTPALPESERTIFWTPTESARSRWS